METENPTKKVISKLKDLELKLDKINFKYYDSARNLEIISNGLFRPWDSEMFDILSEMKEIYKIHSADDIKNNYELNYHSYSKVERDLLLFNKKMSKRNQQEIFNDCRNNLKKDIEDSLLYFSRK